MYDKFIFENFTSKILHKCNKTDVLKLNWRQSKPMTNKKKKKSYS